MTMWAPKLGLGKALTAEIVAALARDIDHGRLLPGAQLPTHRELASALGVAIGTVTRAYSRAKAEGLVSGTVGRGMFVAGRAQNDELPDDAEQAWIAGDRQRPGSVIRRHNPSRSPGDTCPSPETARQGTS